MKMWVFPLAHSFPSMINYNGLLLCPISSGKYTQFYDNEA